MDISFTKALSERYLAYALSTIVSRSLPDVRDGLKPVHRRLIYAMHELNLNPDAHFKKCARVVGDVMGKFHPHGDAAIYGAMVRLAQDFSVRYPLIEGQGNFGNVDGDSAAAMRYTEARLTPLALELLRGIEENAIDMKDNYDGETHEPLVLPSCFPNILANGATGIAVGMATSIPPHNLEELCESLISIIDSPNLPIHIPGPDFPTGGVLVDDPSTIQKIYETGKGSFRLRARFSYEIEKGGNAQIVITEIPYQVEKSQLIKKIADLIIEKKIVNLEDIRDESADDIRIVLDIKNKSNPYIIMEQLFKATDLEVRVPVNLNVLNAEQVPMVMSLIDILKNFLKHRISIQKRILETRLEKILKRLFILEGYLIIYKHLDDVIKIIRFQDDPKDVIAEKYHLKMEQIEAILNMRLRSLQKLQENEIKTEYEKLTSEKLSLEDVLNSELKQKNLIKQDFKRLIKVFGKKTDIGMRRTTFEKIPEFSEEILEESVEKEDVIIVCSSKNWIRLVKTANDLKYKEGDQGRFIIPSSTADTLIVCTVSGRFFTLPVHKIPKSRSTGHALRDWLNIEDEVLAVFAINNDIKEFLLISEDIKGFRVKVEDVIAQTRAGKQICTEGVVLKKCLVINKDAVLLVASNRKMLALNVEKIPVLSKGKGVILQRATRLCDAILVNLDEGFSWVKKGKTFHEKDLRKWVGARGSSGRLPPLNFPKENVFSE